MSALLGHAKMLSALSGSLMEEAQTLSGSINANLLLSLAFACGKAAQDLLDQAVKETGNGPA